MLANSSATVIWKSCSTAVTPGLFPDVPALPGTGKLLTFAEYGILNGGERSYLSMVRHLQRWGWQITVALPQPSEFDRALRAQGISTTSFERLDASMQPLTQEAKRRVVLDTIIKLQPDLTHFNSLATSRLGGPVARSLPVPSIGHLRDIINISKRAIADINQLDQIVVVSRAVRDHFTELGMDSSKMIVVHNGVDLSEFSPARKTTESSIRQELSIPTRSPVLLFVGQIGVRKGLDILLEMFPLVYKHDPNCHLLIVGQRNSQKSEAIAFEKTLRGKWRLDPVHKTLANHVHWLGRRPDIARLMRQSTLLVHPARQEPLGRVLLEACATGLPVVTTRVGGSAEIFAGLSEEVLVPPDPEELADRCIRLLQNGSERQAFAQTVRRIACRRFADQKCAEQTGQIFARLNSR